MFNILHLSDTLQHLQHTAGMGQLDYLRIFTFWVEIVPEVKQGILTREPMLEYLLKVQLGGVVVCHFAERPSLQVWTGQALVTALNTRVDVDCSLSVG